MPLGTNRSRGLQPSLIILWLVLFAGPLTGAVRAQETAPPPPVPESIVRTLIQQWAQALVRHDLQTLQTYYADPKMIRTWQQRIAARKPLQVNLLAIHEINSGTADTWGSQPLVGEVVFTVEYWLEGVDRPLNETRVWGLTNSSGFLQIASDAKRKEPLIPPRRVETAAFPQLGEDPSATVALVEPLPEATPLAPAPPPAPTVAVSPTPTPKDAPIPKKELIDQLWNTLLLKFKHAYEYRSEKMFLDLFPKKPVQALETFRNNIKGRGWIQVTELAIDADSVKGNRLNSTFRFRYSLWGSGMEKDKIVEVDCAAVYDGSRWQFAKFGDEVIVPPRRTKNFPLPDYLVKPLLGQQQRQGFLSNLFGN